jgi:hypothetical protein
MTLIEIAKICWDNKITIPFGNNANWDTEVFLEAWFKRKSPEHWVVGSDAPGWYWFASNIPLIDLKDLVKPNNLPNSACDFGDVSKSNATLFNSETCQNKSHINIVYNGQDANVLGRIRAHFFR